jgi:hypothetical protein
MVSSTGVTLELSRHALDPEASPDLMTSEIAVATALMFPRILLIVGVITPALAIMLAWPMLAALAAALAMAAWYGRGVGGKLPEGEWRRGISPLRSLRTGREPRDSSGSHCPAMPLKQRPGHGFALLTRSSHYWLTSLKSWTT